MAAPARGAVGAYIEFSGGICPLTPMENRLRAQGRGSAYSGGFVEHYLLSILYPAELTTALQQTICPKSKFRRLSHNKVPPVL